MIVRFLLVGLLSFLVAACDEGSDNPKTNPMPNPIEQGEWVGGNFILADLPSERTPSQRNFGVINPCNSNCFGTNPPRPDSDKQVLAQIVQEFETRFNISTRIRIDILSREESKWINSNSTVAACIIAANSTAADRFIEYNSFHWNSQSYQQKKYTIFHELGHCVFLREHDCRTKNFSSQACGSNFGEPPIDKRPNSNNMALSIMYPSITIPFNFYNSPTQDEYIQKWNFFNPERFFDFNADYMEAELNSVYNDIGFGQAPTLIFSMKEHGCDSEELHEH